MSTADLYIRVSTDEQADKGYSQRNQEETLRRYCLNQGIEVREVIHEDHSAKTFKRPAWQGYISRVKKHRHRYQGLVLFTKWDRFSRNAGDAYQMINILEALGIEPQAIEQPLDLSIPENKMMLAIYLAAPQVENERRALNVFYGMRRARKEGRFVSAPPVGYGNFNENGRKYIAAKYPQADIMKWAFSEISKGEFTTEQIWRVACKKGLKVGRNNFYTILRNPVYCGKILVPAYRDEPEYWAEGQHEGIITETLFRKVQEILSGRKTKGRKIYVPDQLPLRGYLYCGNCQTALSGSASKGRSAYYYYYHGFKSCRCRYKAVAVNTAFVALLKTFIVNPAIEPVFKKILKQRLAIQQGVTITKRTELEQKIERLKQRLHKARELMLSGDLEPTDYQEIKVDADVLLTQHKQTLDNMPDLDLQLSHILQKSKSAMLSLDGIYKKASTENKRSLIAMLFKGKLIYMGTKVISTEQGVVLNRCFDQV